MCEGTARPHHLEWTATGTLNWEQLPAKQQKEGAHRHAAQPRGASGCAAALRRAARSTRRSRRPTCAPGGPPGCSTTARRAPRPRSAVWPSRPEHAVQEPQSGTPRAACPAGLPGGFEGAGAWATEAARHPVTSLCFSRTASASLPPCLRHICPSPSHAQALSKSTPALQQLLLKLL